MAKLSASERTSLPDAAFAYVDSKGARRLPIHDASHVRNALARFGQVRFESETARSRARDRLLRAAKKHGIVPLGFISAQLEADRRHTIAGRVVLELGEIRGLTDLERRLRKALDDPSLVVLGWAPKAGTFVDVDGAAVRLPVETEERRVTIVEGRWDTRTALVHGREVLPPGEVSDAVIGAVRFVMERHRHEQDAVVARLPSGSLTHLLTDIEGSTPLLDRLGDGYAGALATVRDVIRRAVLSNGGREVDARADEFYAVFEESDDALAACLHLQRRLADTAWPAGETVRVRAGLHTGEARPDQGSYVGMAVHAAARVASAAHGGQILTTTATIAALRRTLPQGVGFTSLGVYPLAGLPEPVELFQVDAPGLATGHPPPRMVKGGPEDGR